MVLAPCLPRLQDAKVVDGYEAGMTFGDFAASRFSRYYGEFDHHAGVS